MNAFRGIGHHHLSPRNRGPRRIVDNSGNGRQTRGNLRSELWEQTEQIQQKGLLKVMNTIVPLETS